ncbi:MAG: hypothetical protein P0Y53_14100 [Candidatus Pseudobacter hemicellulosilyticus]|uniref:Uncharacterized protein n=1 Tax=Candidatus Pseudobacter hemicellulosilyticus TaxID=3121375 RepID=A0AAJ6BDH0_9BACT|nr:MAG: hypothetical protein P0Y53_14100 [Pseudobacter sp.]
MEEYIIPVNKVEELQTIRDLQALETIFDRARRTIIGGSAVILVREKADGSHDRFDTLTTESDFEAYRQQVFRYL